MNGQRCIGVKQFAFAITVRASALSQLILSEPQSRWRQLGAILAFHPRKNAAVRDQSNRCVGRKKAAEAGRPASTQFIPQFARRSEFTNPAVSELTLSARDQPCLPMILPSLTVAITAEYDRSAP